MCEEQLVESFINATKSLKRHLIDRFGDEICFYPAGRQVKVYASDMNPCQFSVATMKGYELEIMI